MTATARTQAYTLRGFTDFDSHRVPKHDAFNRAFNRLSPKTLETINQAVIQAALELGLEDGKKLRVDTTVVENQRPLPHRCHLAMGLGAHHHANGRGAPRETSLRGGGLYQSHP